MNQSPWIPVLILVCVTAIIAGVAMLGTSNSVTLQTDPVNDAAVDENAGADASAAQTDTAADDATDGEALPRVADFTLPDLAGNEVNFKSFVSGRPFAITFGQTRCPYCVRQIAEFKKAQDRLGSEVAFLYINVTEPAARVAAHVKRIESPFTTLLDMDDAIYGRYGSGKIPVTLVGDRNARILTIDNLITADELIRMVEGLSKPEGAAAR